MLFRSVRQTVAKLQDICQGKTIGVVKAAENDYEADIVVASVQSAHRKQRSEEHTSELQSHSFISYAVFCLKKKKKTHYLTQT